MRRWFFHLVCLIIIFIGGGLLAGVIVSRSWILGTVGIGVITLGFVGMSRNLNAAAKESQRKAEEKQKEWEAEVAWVKWAMEQAKIRCIVDATSILSSHDIYLEVPQERIFFPEACWYVNNNQLIADTLATLMRSCKRYRPETSSRMYCKLGEILAKKAQKHPTQALAVATMLQSSGIDLAKECYGATQ